MPFTPNESEQRLPPPYYRGCWHGVSRGFLSRYCQTLWLLTIAYSPLVTGLYNPKAFIAHAASLRQGFPHCERFSTAASRRSLGSVSVPVWLTILSDQLPVNCLGEPLPHQQADRTRAYPQASGPEGSPTLTPRTYVHGVLSGISISFEVLFPT